LKNICDFDSDPVNQSSLFKSKGCQQLLETVNRILKPEWSFEYKVLVLSILKCGLMYHILLQTLFFPLSSQTLQSPISTFTWEQVSLPVFSVQSSTFCRKCLVKIT